MQYYLFLESIIINSENQVEEKSKMSNISVILKNGIGAQISSVYHRLEVIFHVPIIYKVSAIWLFLYPRVWRSPGWRFD